MRIFFTSAEMTIINLSSLLAMMHVAALYAAPGTMIHAEFDSINYIPVPQTIVDLEDDIWGDIMLNLPFKRWPIVFQAIPPVSSIDYISAANRSLSTFEYQAILFADKAAVKTYLAQVTVREFSESHQRRLISMAVNSRDTLAVRQLIKYNGGLQEHLDSYLRFAIRQAATGKDLDRVRYLLHLNPSMRTALDYPIMQYKLYGNQQLADSMEQEFGPIPLPTDEELSTASRYFENELDQDSILDPITIVLAVRAGDLIKLTYLLRRGVKINVLDNKEESLLSSASSLDNLQETHWEIFMTLVDHGVDLNAVTNGCSPLLLFVIQQKTRFICKLLEYGILLETRNGNEDETALHAAASFGHLKALKLLLDFGANVNAENSIRETPLKIAIDIASGQHRDRRLIIQSLQQAGGISLD